MKTQTQIDLVVLGLPAWLRDKIDREEIESTDELMSELRKLSKPKMNSIILNNNTNSNNNNLEGKYKMKNHNKVGSKTNYTSIVLIQVTNHALSMQKLENLVDTIRKNYAKPD